MKMDKIAACIKINWFVSKGDTALNIFEDGGVQFGSFEIKNPDLSPSPIYLNLRTPQNGGSLTAYTVDRIAKELLFTLKEYEAPPARNEIGFGLVAGIPNAGISIAKRYYEMFLSERIERRYRLASFEKQGSGSGRSIITFSAPMPGRALIIDDVVSGADTKLEAAAAVEKAGCEVAAFLVCIDREQGGKEKLEKRGYKIISAYKISELLEFYMLLGIITNKKRCEVTRYIERTKKIITAS